MSGVNMKEFDMEENVILKPDQIKRFERLQHL